MSDHVADELSIDVLKLNHRAARVLKENHIDTLGKLQRTSAKHLLMLHQLGPGTLAHIQWRLGKVRTWP